MAPLTNDTNSPLAGLAAQLDGPEDCDCPDCHEQPVPAEYRFTTTPRCCRRVQISMLCHRCAAATALEWRRVCDSRARGRCRACDHEGPVEASLSVERLT